MREIKIGSLFDGIGAFPYATSLFGVKTVWASEILPTAVSVTKRHFPDMIHVGNITKVSGELLPPVDVVCFGSPCQDLSQASGGNRKGLSGERSGLFMEAIRIINEMRKSTNGKYPRYAVWENVPGCFSSNGRRDYQAVLEAFTETSIPMPESGKWTNAGLVRSERANLAWCVFDACRGFGLAQRRKRVFLVADFGKGRPEEILLVPKSLRRYPPQSFGEGQGVTAAVESGVGSANGFDGYNGQITGNVSSTLGVNCGMSTGRNGVVYGICSLASNSMKSPNPNSGVYEANTARTLDLNCGNPSCNQGGMAVVAFNGGASPQAGSIACSDKVSPTLKSASSGLRTPCVCEPQIARTLTARGDSGPCVDRGQNIVVHPAIARTLCASAAGLSRPGGMGSETDLSIAYATFSRKRSDSFQENDVSSTQTARQHKDSNDLAVAIDCRNCKSAGKISGALQAKNTPGYSLNYQNPVHDGYIVRRLTPTECERLMGLPDGYTAYGHDGKEISDSKRYQMLGNSIAVPCAAYIIQGILEQYEKEADNAHRNTF